MILKLRDLNGSLVLAWRDAFAGDADVSVSGGDIFGESADAIISPANSFGYMDGGIDGIYLERFGAGLQTRLQEIIKRDHLGELPVGQAVLVETGEPSLPYLISAPTMRIPMNVAGTVNAYLALRAALLCAQRAPKPIRSLLCPGLASAIGGMPPARVAAQMKLAWSVVIRGAPWPPATGAKVLAAHRSLTE